MKTITITNIDGVVKKFDIEGLFINYTQAIYRENEEFTEWEDTPSWPETVDQCLYYIREYCDNLTIS